MFLPVPQNGEVNMRKNPYMINVVLGILVGAACLMGILTRTLFPENILPRLDVPVFVLFSALACAIVYYMNGGERADKIGSALLAGLTFSLLPFCAGLTFGIPVWKLFLAGTVVFFLTDLCYEGIGKRMETGAFGKIAPLANGMMLFLASQCFQGIFFK